MRRLIILTIPILLLCLNTKAQKHYDFATIEARMTYHYVSGNWDSIIYYGKAGIADSIDNFYLRKHLGEAYYYKQDYLRAIPHFEVALNDNPGDTSTREFIYYSYLYSGRANDAVDFQWQIAQANHKEYKNSRIENVYGETGTSANNNFSKNQNIDFNGGDNLFGTAEMSGSVTYGHLGLKAQLSHIISIYFGGSISEEQKKTIFNVSNVSPAGRIVRVKDTMILKPLPPPAYYTHDTIFQHVQNYKFNPLVYNDNNTLHQNEFYLNLNLHASKGLDITPFLHLLNTRFTIVSPNDHAVNFTERDTIITHTQYHFPPDMGGAIVDTVFTNYNNRNVKLTNYSFQTKDTSFTNFALGIVLCKSMIHFTYSLFASYSNLNGRKQEEIGVALTWFPQGNLNLYFGTTLTGYRQDSNKLVANFLAGKRIAKKIWLEADVTFGDMNDFTEKYGYAMNNNPDVVKFRFELAPLLVFKHFDITIHYQYQAKQGYYFFQDENYRLIQGTFNYQNQLITGGIRWKI